MIARSRLQAGSRMEPTVDALPPQLDDEKWRQISDLFLDPAGPGRRSSSCERSSLLRRHSLGAAERCALERLAQVVPVLRHVLAPLCRLVRPGPVRQGDASVGRST